MSITVDDRPTTLYRYFASDGALLYVGITWSRLDRMNQHAETSRWWQLAVRCELEHFASRADALRAESAAIRDERPRYNVMGLAAPRVSPGQLPLPVNPNQGSRWLLRARALRRAGLSDDAIGRALGRGKWLITPALRENPGPARFGRDPWGDLIRLLAAFDWPDLEPVLATLPGRMAPEHEQA